MALLGAGLLALQPVIGLAQDWPRKPIRVVIPFAVGSVSEAIFRTISPGVETNLGQRFVVESKPGADGAIGTGEVVRAAPDGYTLLLGPTAVYAVTPHMFKNLGFDPLTALEPISLLADAPLLAVIGANVPAKSLKESGLELVQTRSGATVESAMEPEPKFVPAKRDRRPPPPDLDEPLVQVETGREPSTPKA